MFALDLSMKLTPFFLSFLTNCLRGTCLIFGLKSKQLYWLIALMGNRNCHSVSE